MLRLLAFISVLIGTPSYSADGFVTYCYANVECPNSDFCEIDNKPRVLKLIEITKIDDDPLSDELLYVEELSELTLVKTVLEDFAGWIDRNGRSNLLSFSGKDTFSWMIVDPSKPHNQSTTTAELFCRS